MAVLSGDQAPALACKARAITDAPFLRLPWKTLCRSGFAIRIRIRSGSDSARDVPKIKLALAEHSGKLIFMANNKTVRIPALTSTDSFRVDINPDQHEDKSSCSECGGEIYVSEVLRNAHWVPRHCGPSCAISSDQAEYDANWGDPAPVVPRELQEWGDHYDWL